MAACVRNAGFTVELANNGREAEGVIGVNPPALLISDIRMSPGNGIELLHYVKRTRPELPVILMTGFAEIAETQEAHSLGAQGFLAKPFKQEDLLNLIRSFIESPSSSSEQAKSLELSSASDDDFCKIMIEEFISGREIKYDIFIRLTADKFVKIAHEGENIDIERIRAYKDKGVTHLYLRKTDFSDYIGWNLKILGVAKENRLLNRDKRIALVKAANEAVLEYLYTSEIDSTNIEHAKLAVENTLSVMTESNDVLNLMTRLQDQSDFLYAESIAISTLCVMVAKKVKWSSASNTFRLAMAGMICNIGKKEIDPAIFRKQRIELTPEDIRQIESHPMRGTEILAHVHGLPTDILQIIIQHHENCAGTGYPYGLAKKKIHPMARLILVAETFVELAVTCPRGARLSPPVALQHMATVYAKILDPVFLFALAEIYNIQLSLAKE